MKVNGKLTVRTEGYCSRNAGQRCSGGLRRIRLNPRVAKANIWHLIRSGASDKARGLSVAKTTTGKSTKPASEPKAAEAPVKGKKVSPPKAGNAPNALQKPMQPSEELAVIVGSQPLARGEVVSKVWEYIKKNDLQNPANKREILADEALKKIFGKDKATMFEMNKFFSQHLS